MINCLQSDENDFQEYTMVDNIDDDEIPEELDLAKIQSNQDFDKESQQIFFAFQSYNSKVMSSNASNNEVKKEITSLEQLNSLPPEERKYYIYNHDTGQVIDSRDINTFRAFSESTLELYNSIKVKKNWSNYWKLSKIKKLELLDASEVGDNTKIKQLLEHQWEYYLNVNCRGLDQWSPLHFACNEGHLQTVRILIDFKADLELQTQFKRTPLHISCRRGLIDISRELIQKGANVNVLDRDFNTPLHFGVQSGNKLLVQLLIQSNANFNQRNYQQQLPCDMTTNMEMLALFQKFGIDICENKNYGRGKFHETNTIIPNSRVDHVMNLLLKSKTAPTSSYDQKSYNVENKLEHQIPKRFINLINQVQNIAINFKNHEISFDSFLCHSKLGSGAFGHVYLVEKRDNKKLFAMKIMLKEKFANQNFMRYAQTEKDVLSIMKHPFIVNLNYAFQTDLHLVLVMEYCSGGDLSKQLDRYSKLTEDVAKIYVAEITLALEALHDQAIIFRDLKPDNIVLDEEGHALLTDFGLSKVGIKKGMLSGSFCGSPAYMAPEILNKKGHSRTVDWYLLGVCTYEMLVGVPPYYSESRNQLYENIKNGILKIPNHISKNALNFIISLLDRNPQTRLGAQRDGEEIRQHPWLADIDWQKCFERKLKPPKPYLDRKTLRTGSDFSDLGFYNQKLQDNISNWDFHQSQQFK